MKLFKEKSVKRSIYIATDLRKVRKEKGIGLRQLAKLLNLSAATLSALECGVHTTTKKTAEKIENYLLK